MSETEIRTALFLWLKERSKFCDHVFTWKDLISGFNCKGQKISLVGARGIWVPKGFSCPLSLTTTVGSKYPDGMSDEGFLDYSYQGDDPNNHDNRCLREAFRTRTPMVYFLGIKPGKYIAVWPIFIIEDHPERLSVRAAIDPAYQFTDDSIASFPGTSFHDTDSGLGIRRYITTLTKQRLHQTAFREYVLDAYGRQCTMCRLQHAELLDAAHIIPDSEPDGQPIVPNGLSLCKIHHAAYDNMIIGVSPDYDIRVRTDILEEIDGPMLKYGLQSLEGGKIILPQRKNDYPDRDRLARRYALFQKAG